MDALIERVDINNIRRLSTQVNFDDFVDNFVIEAQRFDIRPFLGEAFFYDVSSNPTETNNEKLLDGGEWVYCDDDVEFDGLKVAIAYFSWSRYIQHAQANGTAYGIVIKLNDNSEPVTEEMISRLVNQSRSSGKAVLEQLKFYLDNNSNLYPLWCKSEQHRPSGGASLHCVTNY